ncbi:MAG: hypothetical protein LC620_08455, partial [Halobacteriales archaeon]|nr:hypothetical protein [Halobacteriales archaeon]
ALSGSLPIDLTNWSSNVVVRTAGQILEVGTFLLPSKLPRTLIAAEKLANALDLGSNIFDSLQAALSEKSSHQAA